MHRFFNALRGINYTRLVTKLLIIGSLTVLVMTGYFVLKLDVLTGWTIKVPAGDIHAGDTIVVESVYTKLMDVSGTASRYVECETRPGVYVSYLVNQKKADRRAGKGGTGVEIPIPRGIANLPTQCRVRISISYPVLPFRTVNEAATSDDFTLLPETEESRIKRENETSMQSAPQTTPAQVPPSVLPSVSPSSTQNTATAVPVQPEMSPSEPVSLQAPADESITGVNIIDGVLRAIGL